MEPLWLDCENGLKYKRVDYKRLAANDRDDLPEYDAQDDDLPDFFQTGKLPAKSVPDPAKMAEAATQLHYPRTKVMSELEKQRARWEKREEKSPTVSDGDAEAAAHRKVYVKSAKTAQMHDWLSDLDKRRGQLLVQLTPWELRFFDDMSRKFRRYYPQVKWITEKQYRALERIAVKYVTLPEEARRET